VPARRIVSLIPSITEILFAIGAGDRVVGCTIYCTQPPDGVATKTRIGGEKNPNLELIRDLGTDLVIANVEENVREHVETLRAWGIPVHVTYPRTVADGIRLVGELGELLEAGSPARELEAALRERYDEVRAAAAGRRPRRGAGERRSQRCLCSALTSVRKGAVMRHDVLERRSPISRSRSVSERFSTKFSARSRSHRPTNCATLASRELNSASTPALSCKTAIGSRNKPRLCKWFLTMLRRYNFSCNPLQGVLDQCLSRG